MTHAHVPEHCNPPNLGDRKTRGRWPFGAIWLCACGKAYVVGESEGVSITGVIPEWRHIKWDAEQQRFLRATGFIVGAGSAAAHEQYR